MAGFGGSSWGSSPWGGGALSISIESAEAKAKRLVRVHLTGAAKVVSEYAPGDATNPNTWRVVRLDTGLPLTVIIAVAVDARTVDLTTIEDLGGAVVTHRVETSSLRSSVGALVEPPKSADFQGIGTQAEADAAQAPSGVLDLHNPPTPYNPVGGTLVVGADGDYKMVGGDELLRKLILRRLTTRRGGFRHLPEYGLGIRLKEPLPGELVKLRAAIEREVKREPEVVAASASLSLRSNGVLTVSVRARTRGGSGALEVSLDVPPDVLSM